MCIPILCTNALHLRLKIERDLCLELQLSLTGKSLLFHIRLLATHMGTADVVTRPKIAMTSLESYKRSLFFNFHLFSSNLTLKHWQLQWKKKKKHNFVKRQIAKQMMLCNYQLYCLKIIRFVKNYTFVQLTWLSQFVANYTGYSP